MYKPAPLAAESAAAELDAVEAMLMPTELTIGCGGIAPAAAPAGMTGGWAVGGC